MESTLIPRKRRPEASAAAANVPDPQQGSSAWPSSAHSRSTKNRGHRLPVPWVQRLVLGRGLARQCVAQPTPRSVRALRSEGGGPGGRPRPQLKTAPGRADRTPSPAPRGWASVTCQAGRHCSVSSAGQHIPGRARPMLAASSSRHGRRFGALLDRRQGRPGLRRPSRPHPRRTALSQCSTAIPVAETLHGSGPRLEFNVPPPLSASR